jgi:2-dehydro-3-deoxy-D-arabinonate dehydratase
MIKVYRSSEGAVIAVEDRVYQAPSFSFDAVFQSEDPQGYLKQRIEESALVSLETLEREVWLPPLESQEVWASGVTYYRSREARMEESEQAGGDVFYDKVYEAERPELFFKATPARARGHGAPICIREDSSWDVPEPELTIAVNAAGRVFGYTIGNDVSSRSIEGENPLYLPQAKVYRGSCAMGPALCVGDPLPKSTRIELSIHRDGAAAFTESTDLSQLKRSLDELAAYLFRENEFPHGCWLMTGTGIVPSNDFTLASGDRVRIAIDGLGVLENVVE